VRLEDEEERGGIAVPPRLLLLQQQHPVWPMSVRCQRINTSLSDGDAGRTCWHHGRAMRNRLPVGQLREPLWKRQPGETTIAFASFQSFRNLKPGERSIARVCRDLGKNPTMREDRARRWRWLERVDNWDAHLEEIAIASQESAVAEMNERHAFIAVEGLRKVLQRLRGDEEAHVTAIDASRLTPSDCARLVEVLSKLERLSRGAESERVEQSGQPVTIRFAFNATPNIVRPEQGIGYVDPAPPRELRSEH
jgi:hypothetical protein